MNSDEIFNGLNDLLTLAKFQNDNIELMSLRNEIENIRCMLIPYTFMYDIYEDSSMMLIYIYEYKLQRKNISNLIYETFHNKTRDNIETILNFKRDNNFKEDYRVLYILGVLSKILLYIEYEAKENN